MDMSGEFKVNGTSNAYNGLVPQTLNNGSATGTYVSLGLHGRAMFCCQLGTVAQGGTIAWQVLQATDAAGTGSKNFTGGTQSGAIAAMTTSNTTQYICVDASQLDVANGYDHIAIKATEGGSANVAVACQIVRGTSRYKDLGMTVGT